ncbi:MAG: hypothetical protein OHK93_001131 [Ramalina farinacea]|uniref:PEBP-like protein n=1 Tax=Ramalina farinacea TaxID=258253 RepID=A0AA43TZ72_9LECA|nr:hypothetical protein [Ramalina farinacea]
MEKTKIFETVEHLFKDESTILKMSSEKQDNIRPGQEVARAGSEAEIKPQLSFNPKSPAGSYIVIALDVDAPVTPLGALTPVLLWIQSNLSIKRNTEGRTRLSTAGHPFIVNYSSPKPLMDKPHRYLFLLYEQPADFDFRTYVPRLDTSEKHRKLFNLEDWVEETKLGPVVAANYFSVW